MSAENEDAGFPTMGKLEDEKPSADWTVDKLGRFAEAQEGICAGLGRKMAIHRFREGLALTLAQGKVGYGGWMAFLGKHGISHSSEDRARKLYEMAKNEKNLEGLTIMEAYRKYGIEPKQAKAKGAGTTSSTSPASPPKPSRQRAAKVGEPPTHSVKSPSPSGAPDVHNAEDESRIVEEFDRFATTKGWDEDRKAQVVAVLTSLDPVEDLLREVVKAGSGDEVIGQLHQYVCTDGVCYLRIRSTATATDEAGMYVESMKVQVRPPG